MGSTAAEFFKGLRETASGTAVARQAAQRPIHGTQRSEKTMSASHRTAAAVATLLLLGSQSASAAPGDDRPGFLKGPILSATYDGLSDDLLTGGLGKSGLAGACPAAVAAPTAAQLRVLAICNNYKALVNVTARGGYGTLYGPNVDAFGNVTAAEGKIAGEEHLAYADDGSGRENVTLMVQIPATFDIANPCIVSASSSGSRGVYGAIGTAGEWGLKRGCAVAYTDKGTGNGGHDLAADAVNLIRGERAPAAAAGDAAQFRADLSPTELAAFNAAYPNRWAFKHAHSQQHSEKDWGRDTLRAIRFAFYVINTKYGTPGQDRLAKPKNAIVIASSVSNGGGAAIMAAEEDGAGLIDGVAVAEPQIQLDAPSGLTILRGATPVGRFGASLYDYFTFANLYQPCASLATAAVGNTAGLIGITTPNALIAANRCAALAALGLVSGTTATERGDDALAKLLAYGWEADAIPFIPSHWSLATLSVTLTYANAYSRASVADNLCGYSFGAAPIAGVPTPLNPVAAANIFGTGNGVPPTSGINIINNHSVGGAALDAISISPSTGMADFNVDGAVCMRNLLAGSKGSVVSRSIEALKVDGNLKGKPAIIVHGRADTLIPVNHTSRPYYALNKSRDNRSRLAYYEVENAQHFDAFIDNPALPGYDTRLVPLHVYFNQAMDLMYDHLRNGTAIPPSQVVRTVPRGGVPGAAPQIMPTNVPPIATAPAAADAITFANGVLSIPD
jgi:hydroxybutyrate-dimer hydrolase